jgi:phosphopantetheinyl transferase
MGWPQKEAVIRALGSGSPQNPGKIHHVKLLGDPGSLKWKQEADGLKVEMPAEKISDIGITLKVELA